VAILSGSEILGFESFQRRRIRLIWYKKLERQTPEVKIAPEKEGRIAFIHRGSCFLAALMKTVIDILEEDKGLENELLTYWMYLKARRDRLGTTYGSKRKRAVWAPPIHD
jgi:hypothetical protein